MLDILLKWAFEKGEESKHQDLIDIGWEIVKKCGGIPLAARTLGALLFSKTNMRDWLSVRDSEIWAIVQKENDILPILKLSYDQMPSYLKQCFGYCSLFEKNERMSKYKLIYGWMAHGFLQSSDRNDELEDVGEDYILELVRRSFLQPTRFLHLYTMHDLVHDLAKYVGDNEYMTIKEEHTKAIPDSIRHVSFGSNRYCKFPTPLIEAKKLRTMFLPNRASDEFRSSFAKVASSSFKCLRVLEVLSRHHSINYWTTYSLPKNVGTLKHLRFLSFTTKQELPNSFCKLLINLQYLDLGGSSFSELPRGFGNLVNLRFLFLPSRLTRLPEKGISELSSLKTLILVGNNKLRSLGGGIRQLTCLRNLVVSDCYKFEFSDDDFKGLRSLKALTLLKLPSLEILPTGLQDAATTLTHLEIFKCSKMKSLSDSVLPKLESLQSLTIQSCPEIRSLPEGMQGLTKLHSLSIAMCPDLTRRCEQGVGEDWPKVAHIPEIQLDVEIDLEIYSFVYYRQRIWDLF